MSTSWFTRSKNFSRSTSTTQRLPSWMYRCASRTASCARRPGRKPWLCSENVGSNIGCSTCNSSCWTKRSSTVGMPNSRTPPSRFGISCRFTALGRKLPANSCFRIATQCSCRYGSSSSTVLPSMPGLPLLRRTRLSATMAFSRATTCSISRPSLPERSFPRATRPASPLRSASGASPQPSSGSSSCLDFWCMAFPRLTDDSLSSLFGPSRGSAPGTTASADFSLRCGTVALSGVRRDLPR